MKTRSKQAHRRFDLKLLGYGNCYYIERIARLEAALARKPRALQIDMIGVGEIPADSALLIRSVLLTRSPKTHLITNARSSLQNGSVLVWLLGDTRLIRDDARLFFRRATLSEDDDVKQEEYECFKVFGPEGVDSPGLPLTCYVKRGTTPERDMSRAKGYSRGVPDELFVLKGVARQPRILIVEAVEKAD